MPRVASGPRCLFDEHRPAYPGGKRHSARAPPSVVGHLRRKGRHAPKAREHWGIGRTDYWAGPLTRDDKTGSLISFALTASALSPVIMPAALSLLTTASTT